MSWTGAREHGVCTCGGHFERRAVEVRMTVAGEVVVLPDVPQGACPVCGARVYKRDVLERIEQLMRSGGSPSSGGE
jgi:YgiT-type zinc finger domain-containing protein